MSKKRAAEADPSPNLISQGEDESEGNLAIQHDLNLQDSTDAEVDGSSRPEEEDDMEQREHVEPMLPEEEEADSIPEEEDDENNVSTVDSEEDDENVRPDEADSALELVPNRVGYAAIRDNQAMMLNQIQTDATTQTTLVELLTAYWTGGNTGSRRMQAISTFSPFRSLVILQGIQILLNYFSDHWFRLTVNTQGGALPLFRDGMRSRLGAYVPTMFALVTSHQFQQAFGGIFHRACLNEIRQDGGNNVRFQMFWITHINEAGMSFRRHGRGLQYVDQDGLTVLEALIFFYLRAFHRHIFAPHIQSVFYYFPIDSVERIVERMDNFIDEHGRAMQARFAAGNFLEEYVRPLYWNLFVPTVSRVTDVMGIIPHEFFDVDNNFGLPREDVFEDNEEADEDDENESDEDNQFEEDSDDSEISDE